MHLLVALSENLNNILQCSCLNSSLSNITIFNTCSTFFDCYLPTHLVHVIVVFNQQIPISALC